MAALALIVLVALSCRSADPRSPTVVFRTPALPAPACYRVFLPPSYAASSRSYPVLYFLHDGFGDRDVLFRQGAAARLEEAMRRGTIPEFLVVCPDGDGSWFSNYHDGSRRYEDYVAFDLPRDVESRFRVLPGVSHRGITGISMGGYGAVKIALHHPDLYGSVSSLSGALIPLEWEDVQLLFWLARRQVERVFGSSPTDNSLRENDLWQMFAEGERRSVPFEVFLLAGTEDKYRLDRVAAQYADFLNRHGIRTEARLEPGIHDWPYWKTAFLEIAAWHGRKFEAAGQL